MVPVQGEGPGLLSPTQPQTSQANIEVLPETSWWCRALEWGGTAVRWVVDKATVIKPHLQILATAGGTVVAIWPVLGYLSPVGGALAGAITFITSNAPSFNDLAAALAHSYSQLKLTVRQCFIKCLFMAVKTNVLTNSGH